MIRAVLDANVLVSAILVEQGAPARILKAWRDEQFHLVISAAILAEMERVLQYPRIAARHRWSREQLSFYLDDLSHLAIGTPGQLSLNIVRADPSDNRYIECALEGEAGYIVSGDDHLLAIAQYEGVAILAPRAFLEMLESESHSRGRRGTP